MTFQVCKGIESHHQWHRVEVHTDATVRDCIADVTKFARFLQARGDSSDTYDFTQPACP